MPADPMLPIIAPPAADRRILPGSDKTVLPGARAMGDVNPEEKITVSIWLKANAPTDARANIEAFAEAYGLGVAHSDDTPPRIVVAGRVDQMNAAFGTRLTTNSYSGGTYRARSGPLTLPSDIVDAVEAVLGLDDRPAAAPHLRRAAAAIMPHADPAAGHAYFTPPELARAYNAAGLANGTGRCVAVISLGGGIVPADLATYFASLGISPAPKVSVVLVDGAANRPDGPQGADGENALDICTIGGVAPGASVVLYLAPNTDRGFPDAIAAAIHDTTNKPDVISISWGGAERNWTDGARKVMDGLFQQAAALGITVTAASGDDGSSDGTNGNAVDYPASSPYVLGCGGTRKTSAAETVWNSGAGGGATGGGFSAVYPPPSYQTGMGFASRSVPDVAAVADPATGVWVRVDGSNTVIGGTSAAAPCWAGLIARLCSSLGRRVGFLNPALYAAHGAGCVDITVGNNGAFHAGPGIDQTTGWGSPDGAALLAMLGGTTPPPVVPPPVVPPPVTPPPVVPPPPASGTTTIIVSGPVTSVSVNGFVVPVAPRSESE